MTPKELAAIDAADDLLVDEIDQDEADLAEALDIMNRVLQLMEDIVIHPVAQRIIKVPPGMIDMMEELHGFLDQWDSATEAETSEVCGIDDPTRVGNLR